jgi:hypothetical protein
MLQFESFEVLEHGAGVGGGQQGVARVARVDVVAGALHVRALLRVGHGHIIVDDFNTNLLMCEGGNGGGGGGGGRGLLRGGVALLTARAAGAGGGDLLGNLICFGSMIAAAGYVALGRRNRDFPSLWLYVVPVYLQAGLICLVASVPWLGTFQYGSGREWLLMLGLALLPTIVGHSMINYGVRHLRGQIVSICNVTQFIFATIMAYFLFHEATSALFYAASAIVVAGVALVVFSTPTPLPTQAVD